jgi:ATP-dependent helicase HrpA
MAGPNRAVTDRLAVIARELDILVPPDFLSCFPDRRVKLLPRYLKGLRIRAERAYVYPEKDQAKESQLNVRLLEFEDVARRVRLRPTQEGLDFLEDVALMIDELRISLFAPEIKTLFPVSDKRIEKKLHGFPV